MAEGGQRPKIRPRLLTTAQQCARDKLLASFKGFDASTVSAEHIEAAKECIRDGGSARSRYKIINFIDILERNEHKPDHLTMMTSAYDLLLKYAINLLKARRPQVWRSIKTNNSAFKARVDCMEGARDILAAIGYSEKTENAMQFPENVVQPDVCHLRVVAAELLMAKLEVEEKEENGGQSQSSPPQQQRSSTDPGEESIQQPQGSDHSKTAWVQANGGDSHQFDQGHYSFSQPLQPPSEGQPPPPNKSPQPKPRRKTLSTSSESSSMDTSSQQQPSHQQPSHQQPSHQQPSLSSSSGGSTSDLTTASESSPQTSFGEAASSSSSTTKSQPSRFKKELDHLSELKKQREAVSQKKQGYTMQVVQPADPTRRGLTPKSATSGILSIPSNDQTHQPRLDDGSIPRAKISPPQSSGSARDAEHSLASARKLDSHSQAIKYPPGRKQHPQYRDDAIPEEEERKPSQPLSGSSDSMGSGPFCEKCKCKLSPASTVCLYCQTAVPASGAVPPRTDSAPKIPPRAKSKLADAANPVDHSQPTLSAGGPIIRATPQAAEEAMKQYRLSRIQETVAFTPIPPLVEQPGALPGAQPPPTSVNSATPLSNQPQQLPPRDGTIDAAPPHDGRGHGGRSEAAAIGPGASEPGRSSGGAAGTSERKTVTGQSWTEMQREKEEAWKQKQLRDGVKPEDMKLLSGEPAHVARRQAQEPRRKIEDPRRFKRECLVGDPEQFANEEKEKRRMEQMETDGATLLFWVKECSNYNYSLDEVQIAFDHYRGEYQNDPLVYLKTIWERKIKNLRLWVSTPTPSVGYPSDVEARRFLVKAKGDIHKAVDDCYKFREQKINELCQKMHNGGKDLPWESAMLALTASEMDVDAACWTVQCGELQPLYEYIFSEWNKVTQTDMEDIKKLIKRDDLDVEIRYRLLLGECKLEDQSRAELVIQLMNEAEAGNATDLPLHYYIGAAKDFQTLEQAKKFLLRSCTICYLDDIPTHDMVTMPGCTDEFCKECFKQHFTIAIKEKTVKHFNCPSCKEPDLANRDMSQELYLELFVQLIKQNLDKECYDLCQQKLTDFNLSKEEKFCWCANEACKSGFINDRDPNIKKIQCHACSKFMCFQCKRPWEEQHQGISCDAFAQWKQENDPEAQEQGLAAHLRVNGIKCPGCHMRYDLARGGCMHFKCTQCPNEFCSGCGQSFRGQQCGKLPSCAKKGLHAHHPRDCLFYLRDFDIKELQDFLRENDIEFDTEPPPAQVEAARQKAAQEMKDEVPEAEAEPVEEGEEQAAVAPVAAEEAKVELKCCVPLQKDLVDGLVDEECGREVKDGHAGICEIHYKEYLVNKINQAKLDPVTMYETEKVKVMLLREEKEVPEKDDDEDDEDFRAKLIEHVKQELPLTRGKANRVEPA